MSSYMDVMEVSRISGHFRLEIALFSGRDRHVLINSLTGVSIPKSLPIFAIAPLSAHDLNTMCVRCGG